MERRKLTKEDIDIVRGIEGFPIGTDEDIIALSDAPYYTACPNPFIEEFIRENGTPYDEGTDDYQREPFASDVSEGKSDPIYMAHAYHTKVPYKAIMQYILHYTQPGDIILDGFAGTGMTGLAAQMCGKADPSLRHELSQKIHDPIWGYRNAILNDLAPIGGFISYNYNSPQHKKRFIQEANSALAKCKEKFGWMYETIHQGENAPSLLGSDHRVMGEITYTVWSDVFICPHCSHEIVYYDACYNEGTEKVEDTFSCPHCHASVSKRECERAVSPKYDELLGETIDVPIQVPVLISYTVGKKKYTKRPDKHDLDVIDRIEQMNVDFWQPSYPMMGIGGVNWGDSWRAGYHQGLTHSHQFYTKRNRIIASYWFSFCKENPMLLFVLTASNINISRMYRFRSNGKGGNLSGTLYISSTTQENNVFNILSRKIKDMECLTQLDLEEGHAIIGCGSTSQLSTVPDNSVDYIFTDPPFGGNLNYSELSFLWETWLKVRTMQGPEAIINNHQKKGLAEYQELMERCFMEYFRVLKPNRWMTVEFHNSQNSVWNAIQEALQKAGFIVADVRTLDKKQGSYKQVVNTTAVKQDLVISVYKPKDNFIREFTLKAGTERTAWAFVRQHLSNLPITVKKGGQLEVLAERQAFLLWDRMVAFHIMRGIAIPMDAVDFYRGLDDKFLKRDGMYFLPNQVNKYDKVRATCDVQNLQFSLFISDEKSAIGWLYQQLDEKSGDGPQTYQDLMPKFMQELKAVDKREKMPELAVILEENFLKDEKSRWYIPDLTKSGDIAKLREKNLLKEFQEYLDSKGKLKTFRSEAIRVGFAKLWKEKNYQAIVDVAERLPEETIQEDSNLLMYYDISLSRV